MLRWRTSSLIFISILLTSLPAVLATQTQGQELVVNGGFENGMQGWTTTGYAYSVTTIQSGAYDASTHPPHSGQYSAKVGYVGKPATIYQIVTIPSKSMAKFTAWYRLEQSASITILLKASDGSTIQQWTESGPTDWTPVTYDLSPTYAGQTIKIEFDGQAYASLQTAAEICYNPFGSYYCSYQTEADYFAFVDDVSMLATAAQYSAIVNVASIPQGLPTHIYVNGSQAGTVSNGQSQQFTFNIGETHEISVDNILYQDNTTRYYCNSSSTTVTTDSPVTFSYTKQYYLTVNSQYGNAAGSGWYDDESKAVFSVDTNNVPIPGILGMLGAKYVFDSWTAGETTTNLQSSILMDTPKSVTATWHEDYTLTYAIIAILVIAIISIILGYRHRLEKEGRKPQAMVYGDQSGIVVDVSQAEEERTRFKESESTQITEPEESQTEYVNNKNRHREDENKKTSDP